MSNCTRSCYRPNGSTSVDAPTMALLRPQSELLSAAVLPNGEVASRVLSVSKRGRQPLRQSVGELGISFRCSRRLRALSSRRLPQSPSERLQDPVLHRLRP